MKNRDNCEKTKSDFIATKNPGQNPRPTYTTHSSPKTTAQQIETMSDTMVKIFYGDYSRIDEDPTTWMQNLNTRRVANDWTDTKAISVFESLLAEDKKAYKWWNDDLKVAELTMDRMDWATVRK